MKLNPRAFSATLLFMLMLTTVSLRAPAVGDDILYGMDSQAVENSLNAPAPPNYRHRPLVEFFTGLSCPSCMNGPHPEMEAIWEENRDDPEQPFAYVVFHELNGGGVDDLATEETRERMRHYQPGVSGTPAAEFDGGYIQLGGLTGGSLSGPAAEGAIEDCTTRYQRSINPVHPLQSLRNDFKYVELFIDQVFTGTGFAVSVEARYLGSNAVLPIDSLRASLCVFMVEDGVEAYSTVEDSFVVNGNVFRGYAVKNREFTLSRDESFRMAAEWEIPDSKVPVRPGNISAVAALFDLDDTASEDGNRGNSAQVPRCIQSATPVSTAFDRENDLPVIGEIGFSSSGADISVEARIEDSDGISKAFVLYNYHGSNATSWEFREMNLSGEEICDDSGVCYAYGDGTASTTISPSGGDTLYLMILAYDGSGAEHGSLGAEARSGIFSFTPVVSDKDDEDRSSLDIGTMGWILGGALLVVLVSVLMVRARKGTAREGAEGSSMMHRLRANRKVFYSIVATAVLVVVILGIYLISLRGGDDAPDFTVTDINGNEFTLSDQRGKVVLIDFMATWCPPCNDVMPELVEVYGEHGTDIVMISVDVDRTESNSDLRSFRNGHGAQWTFARDTDDLQLKYNVESIPKLVIIDAQGDVVYTHVGSESAGKISKEIERAREGNAAGVSLGTASLGLLGFAVVVGVGSFFSPCSFPLLPGYMSYYLGMERSRSMRRALLGGAAAAGGLLTVYLIIGILVGAGGSAITPYIGLLEPIVGGIILLLGMVMLFDVTIPLSRFTGPIRTLFSREKGPSHDAPSRGSYSKLFWYGAGYAGAAAGCTAPLILAITLTALASGGFFSAFMVFMISAGVMAILMVFVTLLIALSAGTILDRLKVSTAWIKRVSGIVLVVVGVYLIVYYLNAFV